MFVGVLSAGLGLKAMCEKKKKKKIEIIPAGAFKKSGTSIQTRMIVVTKGTYILDSRNGIG